MYQNNLILGGHQTGSNMEALVKQLFSATSLPVSKENIDALMTAIDELPADKQRPLRLQYLEGMTRKQIAEHLGWTLSKVHRKISRGIALIQMQLVPTTFDQGSFGTQYQMGLYDTRETIPSLDKGIPNKLQVGGMDLNQLLSPFVAEELEDLVDNTRLSAMNIIDMALNCLFYDENNVECPDCRSYIAFKGTFLGKRPIEMLTCGCCSAAGAFDPEEIMPYIDMGVSTRLQIGGTDLNELLHHWVADELDDAVDTTGLSAMKIIDIALTLLFGDESHLVECPDCASYLAIKGTFSGEPPVEILTCGCCRASLAYDTDSETILNGN